MFKISLYISAWVRSGDQGIRPDRIRNDAGNETLVFCLLYILLMRHATSVLASMGASERITRHREIMILARN